VYDLHELKAPKKLIKIDDKKQHYTTFSAHCCKILFASLMKYYCTSSYIDRISVVAAAHRETGRSEA